MKGIRDTLAIVGTLVLAAASAVGATAQDGALLPGPEAASLVTGQFITLQDPAMDCGEVQFESSALDGVHLRERGRLCGGTAEMSDSRISGIVTFRDGADRYDLATGFADIVWGDITIENEAGAWVGRSVGTSDVADGLAGITYHELVGSGAYEGLSAVLFGRETDESLTGVIFPGVLSEDR